MVDFSSKHKYLTKDQLVLLNAIHSKKIVIKDSSSALKGEDKILGN